MYFLKFWKVNNKREFNSLSIFFIGLFSTLFIVPSIMAIFRREDSSMWLGLVVSLSLILYGGYGLLAETLSVPFATTVLTMRGIWARIIGFLL